MQMDLWEKQYYLWVRARVHDGLSGAVLGLLSALNLMTLLCLEFGLYVFVVASG